MGRGLSLPKRTKLHQLLTKPDSMLTTKEISMIVGVHINTVDNWRLRIRRSDLTRATDRPPQQGPCRCGKTVGHVGRCSYKYRVRMQARRAASFVNVTPTPTEAARVARQRKNYAEVREVLKKKTPAPIVRPTPRDIPFRAYGPIGHLRKQLVDSFMAGDNAAFVEASMAIRAWLKTQGIRTEYEVNHDRSLAYIKSRWGKELEQE